MNTKTLSPRALSVIDQYINFVIGNATCSVPYFNNKINKSRGALRAYVGKGSPKDIYDEVTACLTKDHVSFDALSNESLKKYLTDKNIGIDCSGFSYYILNAESEERGKGHLDKHIHFTNVHGIFGKIRSSLRPAENCNVKTFVDEKNSTIIRPKDIQPGDMITMIANKDDRDHMLVVCEIEYKDFLPLKIHYTHTIAYPEDGVYGTGIRQGYIEILDPDKDILSGGWSEKNLVSKMGNYHVELRRLNWF